MSFNVMPPQKNRWGRSAKYAKCEPARSRCAGEQAPRHKTGTVAAASCQIRTRIYMRRHFTRRCPHRKRGAEAGEIN